jgi:hypothetical protein
MSEPVLIRLTRPAGLTRTTPDYFVQCNQMDCQYVETNAPPCPCALICFVTSYPVRRWRERLDRGLVRRRTAGGWDPMIRATPRRG